MNISHRLAWVIAFCLLMPMVSPTMRTDNASSAVSAVTPAATADTRIFFRAAKDKKYVLYSIDPAGSDLQMLAQVTHRAGPFLVAPNGKQVLFYTDESGGASKLYLMNADGSNIHPFALLGDITWSPDSQWIAGNDVAASSTITNIISDIVIVSVDGSETKRLITNDKDNREPAWSPDGQSILYISDQTGISQLYLMQRDGSNQHLLSPIPVDDLEQPQWSPDGKHIAVLSGTYQSHDFKVVVLNADGSDPQELTKPTKGISIYEPLWSPDSKHLLYTQIDVDADVTSILVVDADGSNQHTLLSDAKLTGWQPQWSPDGKQIAFMMQDETGIDLYVMDADGSHQRKVTANLGNCTAAQWQRLS